MKSLSLRWPLCPRFTAKLHGTEACRLSGRLIGLYTNNRLYFFGGFDKSPDLVVIFETFGFFHAAADVHAVKAEAV